jgi:hypothetical protein
VTSANRCRRRDALHEGYHRALLTPPARQYQTHAERRILPPDATGAAARTFAQILWFCAVFASNGVV